MAMGNGGKGREIRNIDSYVEFEFFVTPPRQNISHNPKMKVTGTER